MLKKFVVRLNKKILRLSDMDKPKTKIGKHEWIRGYIKLFKLFPRKNTYFYTLVNFKVRVCSYGGLPKLEACTFPIVTDIICGTLNIKTLS